MNSGRSDQQQSGNPGQNPQPGAQDEAQQQPSQELPEDPQDWQDLGPFDEAEQKGGPRQGR